VALGRQAASAGTEIFRVALVGVYLRAMTAGATVGDRTWEGREFFRRYTAAAIRCPRRVNGTPGRVAKGAARAWSSA
jgi:hypothetical protein